MKESTARLFRLMEEQNERIRERVEAEQAHATQVGVDEARLRRDAERRERLGQLRARPRAGRRPITGRVIRGYMELG